MEEQVNQAPMTQQIPTPVGSPAPRPKKSANKWLFIFLGLLILGGAGIFFFSASSNKSEPTPTPSFGVIPQDIEPVATATSTPESADKSKVSIEILNGTGISGEAGYLQGKLKALDYTQIEVGNASSTDNSDTTVTFAKDLSTTIQNEIKTELEDIYKKVVVKTSSTQDSDVVIVTGLRSGQTAKPQSTSTPAATTSSSATPSPTASPTPTP